MIPDELDDLADGGSERAIPVRVDGVRRLFDQRTSRRDTDGAAAGVLNAVRDEECWINAVLLPDLSAAEFDRYRDRERWYRLVEVERDEIEPYRSADRSRVDEQALVVIATGERTDETLAPIPSYVRQCLAGAARRGEQFYEEFLATTETARGRSLGAYLDAADADLRPAGDER